MQKLVALTGVTWFLIASLLGGCQSSGGTVPGNELGSAAINNEEELEYKQAIVRCYKTGGTRVVKIMGRLRCY